MILRMERLEAALVNSVGRLANEEINKLIVLPEDQCDTQPTPEGQQSGHPQTAGDEIERQRYSDVARDEDPTPFKLVQYGRGKRAAAKADESNANQKQPSVRNTNAPERSGGGGIDTRKANSSTTGQRRGESNDVKNDTTQTNTKRPNRQPVIGTSSTKHLKVVPPRFTRVKRIFVSRLETTTTENFLQELIKSEMQLDVNCIRLKTKYDTYASFCIETSEENYEALMAPEAWDEGVLLFPFYGRPNNLSKKTAPYDSTGSQGGGGPCAATQVHSKGRRRV
jgi:hypothetical protein